MIAAKVPLPRGFCYYKNMKNTLFFILGIVLLSSSLYFFLKEPASPKYASLGRPASSRSQSTARETMVKISSKIITAEIADTDELRVLGLSGRESLPEDRGMLFIFDQPGVYGIWMKDMNFPIDIVFIDENKQIISTENNVSPDTFPDIFRPASPAKYVLEIPAGFVLKNNVKIEDFVDFHYAQ